MFSKGSIFFCEGFRRFLTGSEGLREYTEDFLGIVDEVRLILGPGGEELDFGSSLNSLKLIFYFRNLHKVNQFLKTQLYFR